MRIYGKDGSGIKIDGDFGVQQQSESCVGNTIFVKIVREKKKLNGI